MKFAPPDLSSLMLAVCETSKVESMTPLLTVNFATSLPSSLIAYRSGASDPVVSSIVFVPRPATSYFNGMSPVWLGTISTTVFTPSTKPTTASSIGSLE